nr:unnamed protein product [Digitaria exilis]
MKWCAASNVVSAYAAAASRAWLASRTAPPPGSYSSSLSCVRVPPTALLLLIDTVGGTANCQFLLSGRAPGLLATWPKLGCNLEGP